ncbi:MAG TPA: DUF4231 domain-containing protein [Roseiarcus sp.]|nr:DUF4231 domain-containing protein [Roseiarcus sp.]
MLRQTWNAYRGWAKFARDQQAATQRWNLAALLFVIAAALLGAVSVALPDWRAGAALLAALASAVAAFLGRQIVGAGDEQKWIQARATAEGLKSECYLYGARAGAYGAAAADAAKGIADPAAAKAAADAAAARKLAALSREIVKQATDKGLVRADNPVPDSGDKREPPASMTKDWYKTGRIQDQIDYYREARQKNQEAADKLWWLAFASGLAAIVFGGLGALAQRFAPWISAMTTLAAAIAGYGLVDRRKYLISSYFAMQSSLEQILGLDAEAPMNLADLVTTTEDLLDGEHKAWLPQMLAMQHQPQDKSQQQAVGQGSA